MPIFMIERTYAEQLDPTDEAIRALNEVNDVGGAVGPPVASPRLR